jgi:GNAT superfamily N-acetyltransferase
MGTQALSRTRRQRLSAAGVDNGWVTIRPLAADDLTAVQQLEVDAGRLFAEIGMPEIAGDTPPSLERLTAYTSAGHAWVLTDPADTDTVIGFVLVDLVDGAAHIEQVSVHPDHGRQGLGRTLIEYVAGWARACGLSELTLTTFEAVPWNGPYYQRLGFVSLTPAELGPQLRAVRAHEAAAGLDRWPRVAMRRVL